MKELKENDDQTRFIFLSEITCPHFDLKGKQNLSTVKGTSPLTLAVQFLHYE